MAVARQREATQAFERASDTELQDLQGRWQHSLDDMGLFTVYGDVALFDRGTALRVRRGEDGLLYAWGWALSRALSSERDIVWRRPEQGDEDLAAHAERGSRITDHVNWKDWHTKVGTCAWRRPNSSQINYLDRFLKLPAPGIPGFPERVSLFAVPPPANTPVSVKPWRLLVYGGCLTIGWPSGDVYARTMVDRLGEMGVFAEVIGCGVSAHTSDQLALGMWKRDFVDKMGLRGEGILRLLKRQGPFDLVLIMVGIADIVRGQAGTAVVDMHRACHKMGARTVAVSVPPSWHDNPEDLAEADVKRAQRLDENFGFCSAKVVAAAKAALNQSLKDLAAPSHITAGEHGHRGHCALYVDSSQAVPCNASMRHLWEIADWIHLTAHGYQSLGRGVAQQLLPLLQRMGSKADKASAKQAEASSALRPSGAKLWRVRGGKRKGGLIVRMDKGTDSLFHSGRLGFGAVLQELELCDDRLHYLKVSGEGPNTGWVSVCTKTGARLVVRLDEAAKEAEAAEEDEEQEQEQEPDGEPGPLERVPEAEPEAAPEAEPDPAPEAAAVQPKAAAPARLRLWRVTGGVTSGGLVVRNSKDKSSLTHSVRLLNGSVLEEMEIGDGKLHYRLRYGSGPHTGWVSISMRGRKLVEPDEDWGDVSLDSIAAPLPAEPKKGQPQKQQLQKTVWRCVFKPRVLIRSETSTSAPIVGVIEFGEEIKAEGEAVGGWVKERRGFILAHHQELGRLLQRVL